MSQLKWFMIVFGLLALSGRFGFADVPQPGRCVPPVRNTAADSLRQGSLDVADLQRVNLLIASGNDAAEKKKQAQEKVDAILAHLDSAKERWLKKIERKACSQPKADDDGGSRDDDRPGKGGPGKAGAMDSDSIMKQIKQSAGLSTPNEKSPNKRLSQKAPPQFSPPAQDSSLAEDPEIMAKTDEVEDQIEDALDDREDECEAKLKREMKNQTQNQMAGQMPSQAQQGGLGGFGQMSMGQTYGGGYLMPSSSMMGGYPVAQQSQQQASLLSTPFSPFGQTSAGFYTQNYSQYYYNPYLQRYAGY